MVASEVNYEDLYANVIKPKKRRSISFPYERRASVKDSEGIDATIQELAASLEVEISKDSERNRRDSLSDDIYAKVERSSQKASTVTDDIYAEIEGSPSNDDWVSAGSEDDIYATIAELTSSVGCVRKQLSTVDSCDSFSVDVRPRIKRVTRGKLSRQGAIRVSRGKRQKQKLTSTETLSDDEIYDQVYTSRQPSAELYETIRETNNNCGKMEPFYWSLDDSEYSTQNDESLDTLSKDSIYEVPIDGKSAETIRCEERNNRKTILPTCTETNNRETRLMTAFDDLVTSLKYEGRFSEEAI